MMNANQKLVGYVLLAWLALLEPAGALPDQTPPRWELGDGTPVGEDGLIALIAEHRQAVANYRGSLADHWQPFRGAKLHGVDLADLVLRAASLQPVAYPDSVEKADWLKDEELPLIDFSYADLRKAEMPSLLFKGADFSGAQLGEANMRGVELFDSAVHMTDTLAFFDTDLSDAGFVNVSALHTMFYWTNLTGARFVRCNFERATFVGVEARNSIFTGCNLTNAWVYGQFQHATLSSTVDQSRRVPTNVTGAIFAANLEGVRWEAVGPPDLPDLAACENLHTLRSRSDGVELVLLRKYFSEAGLEAARRKLTYALRRQRIDQIWDGSSEHKPTWLDRVEVAFEKIFFEGPSRFGMDTKRPLQLLGLSIIFFWPFYFAAVVLPWRSARSGIWAIVAPDEIRRGTKARVLRLGLWPGLSGRKRLWRLLRAGAATFAFSIQTAFTLGYRDINVGAWLARLRAREYVLRATGWVRSIAGLHSLVSFYLLVIWVLSYFGHPFE